MENWRSLWLWKVIATGGAVCMGVIVGVGWSIGGIIASLFSSSGPLASGNMFLTRAVDVVTPGIPSTAFADVPGGGCSVGGCTCSGGCSCGCSK